MKDTSGALKLIMILLAVVIAGYLAIKLVAAILGVLLSLIVPIAVVGAIGFGLYLLVGRKALNGGRRTLP